jgi:hypothetical protein
VPHERLPLLADCSQCAGLCCVALAFDRSDGFAFEKPAGVRCPNLTSCHRCAVHERRAELGMSGCVDYDCLGAGQRVTAMFGVALSEDPNQLQRVFDAFRRMRDVHELAQLLRATHSLDLPEDRRLARDEFLAQLEGSWTEPALADLERSDVPAQIRSFLRALAPLVPARKLRSRSTRSVDRSAPNALMSVPGQNDGSS